MALKAGDIDLPTFQSYLKQYSEQVPDKLGDLERFRMKELPATLQGRRQNQKHVYFTKDELVKLVEWKLKHGTFRPKLLQLVASNSPQEIKEVTGKAFKAHEDKPDAVTNSNSLTSLKGVGIATGSLILSTDDPEHAAFFGDEVFRWLMWDEPTTKPGRGWSRVIAYNLKEYKKFAAEIDAVVKRLDVKAIEVEMVGYVLGRSKADLDTRNDKTSAAENQPLDGSKDDAKKRKLPDVEDIAEPVSKKSAKTSDTKTPSTRSSSRNLRKRS